MSSAIDKAQRLADESLFPQANQVDSSDDLPRAQLELLAAEGLYGLTGPTELGGVGATRDEQLAIIEALAGGCLTTCFVWVQHQGAVGLASRHTGDLHDRFAEPLCRGEIKAGVAFAHLLRPTVVISARPVDPTNPDAGWIVNGTAPWVTGWGYIDVTSVAARHVDESSGTDDVVWMLVDAVESVSQRARRLKLSAVNASSTYAVEFIEHHVPAERVGLVQRYGEWRTDYRKGLRSNASLGLGIAERTGRLLDEAGLGRPFETELAKIRHRLDTAGTDELASARADLSTLTVRMTAALVAGEGGRAVMADHHGQRLAREAIFLMIQGQTAAIKQNQIDGLSR